MKRLFRIDESEKDRILGMHKSAISRQYLKEQGEAGVEAGVEAGAEAGAEAGTETEVAFDCEKIDEVLETPDVKKWVEKITGPARWTIRRGGEKLAEKDVYKGVIDVIKIMQCKLGLEPDGIFGNETNTKLKEFQTGKGLKADGIVGPKTWGAMFAEETESETDTETENNNQNECYMSLGREPIDGQGEEMAGYEVTRVVEDENGNKKVFGFKSDGTGNLNKGAGEQSNPFKWSCENGELKFWQEVQF